MAMMFSVKDVGDAFEDQDNTKTEIFSPSPPPGLPPSTPPAQSRAQSNIRKLQATTVHPPLLEDNEGSGDEIIRVEEEPQINRVDSESEEENGKPDFFPQAGTFTPGRAVVENLDIINDDESGNNTEEDDEDDDDDDVAAPPPEGMYDPSEYEGLSVASEIKDLFSLIMKYTPQATVLETKFKPFVPDYIPAVGDIDAFIKVTRSDLREEELGLKVLDEPSAHQSDANVLELQLRAVSKQSSNKSAGVKKIDMNDNNVKSVDKWIKDISDLHRTKAAPTVHYTKPMPDVDTLMQEWPEDMEELLKSSNLPTAEFCTDLSSYIDMICSLLDIPVHKSRIQSLHVLFTLYSAFKNSQHFNQLANDNNLDNALKDQADIFRFDL